MSLKLLGLMRRANALSVGQDKTIPAIKSGKARLVIISNDASDRVTRNAENALKDRKCNLVKAPYSSEEIGKAIGITQCTILAVTDEGFSKAFCESLKKITTEGKKEDGT